MTEKQKTELAIANGLGEQRRKELTAKEIAKNYPLSKEIGILGDAVEYLFDLVSQLHEGVGIDLAFTDWRHKVAQIKEAISKDIAEKENKL